nr:FixH family protein [Cellulosimicrobium arenosum]
MLAILAGGPAAAHAVLVGTDPSDGQVLDAPPDDLTVTFNEPVQVVEGGTSVLDADGAPVPVSVTAVDDAVVVTPDDALADGTYVVSWRVISLDSHPIAGAFSFSVGAPSETPVDAAAAEIETASSGVVVARAVDQAAVYVGTFLVAGIVVFELLILHATPGAMPVLRARLRRVRDVACGVAVVGIVLSVPLTVAWQAGADLGALVEPSIWRTGFRSDTALAGALGLVGIVAATVAAPRAGRGTRSAWPAAVALGGAALALGSLVLVGHTRTFAPAWLVVTTDVLHVAAGAVWLGGVVGLGLTLAPSARVDPRRAAVTVSRFSSLGAWLVLTLALTGTVLGWRILGTLDALFSTAYGQTLVVKVGVALSIVAVAAWNRYKLVPAMAPGSDASDGAGGATAGADARRRLGRTVGVEAALLVVVLAVTGLLVSSSPVEATDATGGSGDDAAAGAEHGAHDVVVVTEPLGDGTLEATVTPGAVGVNSLEIVLTDADGDPLEPVDTPEVSATLAEPAIGPFDHPLTETATGAYEAPLDLPLPGDWTLTVSVRTSKYESPIVEIPVEVGP